MRPILLPLFLFILGNTAFSQSKPIYIEAFKSLAIEEMDRTGIPASITLAQGILESAWGKGVLARSSNNHFGIKCKSNWTGNTFYLEDDDFDQDGVLMQSCFRGYETAEASYRDHSDFLKNNNRYAVLFELDPTDYFSWAHGLKACGYATDSLYAQKLIQKIEEYQLYEYDHQQVEIVMEAPSYEIPGMSEPLIVEEVVMSPSSSTTVITTPAAQDIPQTPAPARSSSMTLHGDFGLVPVSGRER